MYLSPLVIMLVDVFILVVGLIVVFTEPVSMIVAYKVVV